MNDAKYYNQNVGEMVENVINCTAYQALQFIDNHTFDKLMISLIDNIATTFYMINTSYNDIPLHKIRYFGTFYLSIHGDEYQVKYINSNKIKVIRE